jgi:hypothetical protein
MESSNSSIWRKIGLGAAITGGVIAGVALLPITLGFGTAGIVGGSIAAGIQAAIGNVAAGSLFAVCTSLGMTGVFASTAAVGAILGAGGLAAYLKGSFDAKKDAELINTTIRDNDDVNIIVRLLECRFPSEREEIAEKYRELYGRNLYEDIINYVSENLDLRLHIENLLKSSRDIYARTLPVKRLLNYQSIADYLEKEFDPEKDALLIGSVISNKDDPLIIVRLLNQRTEEQRRVIIEVKIRGSRDRSSRRRQAIALVIAYMPDYERTYVDTLLVEV